MQNKIYTQNALYFRSFIDYLWHSCCHSAHVNRVYRYPYSNVNFHLSRHSIFAPIVAECFPLHGGLNVNSGKHTHTDRQSCIYIYLYKRGKGYLRCKLFDSEGMQHCGQAGK